MRKRAASVVLMTAAVLACSTVSAWARAARSTAIVQTRPDGKVLVVATGTEGGECSAIEGRLTCHDGRSYAIADQQGCRRVAGGARCILTDPGQGPGGEIDLSASDVFEGGTPSLVTAQESSIEIECEEGDKKGAVYSLSDSDGTGTCSPQFSAYGKVNGGGCSKGGHECAGVDCMHGCTGSNTNCQCRIRSGPKKPTTSAN